MEIGSLAVPYGVCVEPANVASMGGACTFMLKCMGCKHFRTDLSHLPALEAYERQLVAAGEQLTAQAGAGALEGWARTAATPSEEEIERVRYLVERIRETIGELPSDERADQGDRADDGRTDGRACRHRDPDHHRPAARPAARGARAGPQTDPADRRRVGGAEGDQGRDGVPVRCRRVDVAGGQDLQALRRRVNPDRSRRALPAGLRGVGHRLSDR